MIGFKAYEFAFADKEFWQTFGYSVFLAVMTIIMSIILIVPTAYWIRLRLPEARSAGGIHHPAALRHPRDHSRVRPDPRLQLAGAYSLHGSSLGQPLTNYKFGTNVLIIGGYMVLALPYMYRSVDTGMRTVDVRTLTEAAQSLGASWYTIIVRVILPNVRTALLSGALLTFAIVVGEVVLASFLGIQAFGPYLFLLGQHRAYEPAALTFTTFLLTWAAMGIIQLVTGGQGQTAGAH